ncbi:MAG: extracellular substrate binding-like orphan protein GrrP [Cyanobacteria bacterium REEB417]|nr:extracellular substrate binding-like orphan protein GrrP [Cyanobacteria bacterium REEB417]
MGCERSCSGRWPGLVAVGLGLVMAMASGPAARAEGVLERVARSGQLRLIGPLDHPPLLSLDAQGRPQGYGAVVAERITALVGQAVGKPVRLVYEPVSDSASLSQRLGEGKADLACTLPFTWARDEVVDFTMPLGVSGLRLLAPAGRFDGSPAGLARRRIAVVKNSLAETQLRGMQPAAQVQPFADLPAALGALSAGQVEGVIGDGMLLTGLVAQRGLTGLVLTPEQPYLRYAVACAVPENNSAFRNLANRAIAQLQQGYLNGDPADVAAVDRWLGPGTAPNLSPAQIRGVFDVLLLGVEPLRPVPTSAAAR